MSQAVLVWGEVLWDRFPDGAQLGGAPANVAWHLGQAGAWAQLVSRVGDDEWGHKAMAQLSQLVDINLLQVDQERATGEVRHAGEIHAAQAGEVRRLHRAIFQTSKPPTPSNRSAVHGTPVCFAPPVFCASPIACHS